MNKIIQIASAQEDLFIKYADGNESKVICLALMDDGIVELMDTDEELNLRIANGYTDIYERRRNR